MEASASGWEVDPPKKGRSLRWEHALWHAGASSEQTFEVQTNVYLLASLTLLAGTFM